VILAGVRGVTIHDTQAVALPHLSAQFYLGPEDVGRNRAEACKDKLQELNTAVNVGASSATLDTALLKQFQVGGEGVCKRNSWAGALLAGLARAQRPHTPSRFAHTVHASDPMAHVRQAARARARTRACVRASPCVHAPMRTRNSCPGTRT